MKLIMVRHGETVWNAEGRSQGFSDIELSETGRQQAELLAKSLANESLEAIYASDLQRALNTARAIARHHPLEVIADPDLRELDQGILEGLTSQELRENHGDYLRLWSASPATATMPGGESMAELQDRAWRAIRRLVDRHPEGTVVAVSHNLAILSILCKVLNLDLNDFRRLKQDVAAKSIVQFGPRGMSLTCMNDVSHLK